MSFFCRVLDSKQDQLLDRSKNLVHAAHINAIGMFTPLIDKFPFLREADVEHWDFVLSIAGVFMAVTNLNNLKIDHDLENRLMEIVTKDLVEWNSDGIRGFEDCKNLFESEFDRLTTAGHKPKFIASDALGKWIVWNVLGRAPQTNEECLLVRTVGIMITHVFLDWWDK